MGKTSFFKFVFLFALTILILGSIATSHRLKSLFIENQWVIHTHKVLSELDTVILMTIDSKRLEQSFLRLQKPEYLQKYESLQGEISQEIEQLKDLTLDNPRQQQRIHQLHQLMTEHQSISNQIIKQHQMQKHTQNEIALSAKDYALIEKIKNIIREMKREEFSLLSHRSVQAINSTKQTHTLLNLVTIITGAIVFLSYLLTNYKEKKYLRKFIQLNTELKEKSKKANEANRLKSEFLSNMSHELRTPLNGIIGFSSIIRNGKAGPITQLQAEYLGDVLSSANHLLRLINDVLDIAKIESGTLVFYPEEVDVERAINEVKNILRTLIAKKELSFSIKVDPTISTVIIDAAKFKQILYNYISNAIKFTSNKGDISVEVTAESNAFRLTVADTGIGIDAENIPKLFTEFQQIHQGKTKEYEGTGLGLALVKNLVESQGGKVGVETELGKGSRFYAILPLAPDESVNVALPAPVSNMKRDETDTQSKRILLIEDDSADQEILCQILKKSGIDFDVVRTGKEALKCATKKQYSAITLDILLPDMNGWELLHQIRKNGANQRTPVIVITILKEKLAGIGFKIDDFLLKPIQPDELLSSLAVFGLPVKQIKKILIVDNDQESIKQAHETLIENDYYVICKYDGQTALNYLTDETPDAIILELNLPDMDGLDFIQQFRQLKNDQSIPVIVWSKEDLPEARQKILDKYVHTILHKEVEPFTLLAQLQYYLSLNSSAKITEKIEP